jgi:hypothetical protein
MKRSEFTCTSQGTLPRGDVVPSPQHVVRKACPEGKNPINGCGGSVVRVGSSLKIRRVDMLIPAGR